LSYEFFLNEHIQSIDPEEILNSDFMKNLEIIKECFNYNSVDVIKENLLKNGSYFALETYRKMT